AALDALIARSVEEAVQGTWARPLRGRRRERRPRGSQLDLFSRPPPILERECRRAARLIRRLCDTERERAPFRVEATEGDVRLTLAGATLHMRIDRVDALESGGRRSLVDQNGQGGARGARARPRHVSHSRFSRRRWRGRPGAAPPRLLPRARRLPDPGGGLWLIRASARPSRPARALDERRSILLQAPAGSGKTSVL